MDALPGFGTTLPFSMQTQQADLWCWAAVASSVSQAYNQLSPWTQCLIANAVLPVAGMDCCQNKNSPSCNRMWSLETALARIGNLQGKKSSAATFPEIQTAIRDNRRFIACGILWGDGKGHFVAIYGFSVDINGQGWVAVADPKYGYSEYLYGSFLTRYRETGRWRVSYLTKSA